MLLNIMFHAPMGRFQLELISYFTIFYRRPIQYLCFPPCMSFVVNTTFSTGLVGVVVPSGSWLGQLTVGV
jgi:hypothetical protein